MVSGTRSACAWSSLSEIEGIKINGIDIIHWNEAGLITHFKVMVRPLKAINILHQKMGEYLMGKG